MNALYDDCPECEDDPPIPDVDVDRPDYLLALDKQVPYLDDADAERLAPPETNGSARATPLRSVPTSAERDDSDPDIADFLDAPEPEYD